MTSAEIPPPHHDDGHIHHRRIASHHGGTRHRFRNDEAHCRAHGGRYDHRHGFNGDRDPGHVCSGAGVSLQKTGLPLKPCLFPVGFLISILRYNTIHERQR